MLLLQLILRLHRISLAGCICRRLIYLGLLCFPVLEEFLRHSGEQRIGQNVLILLLPLCAFLLKLGKLRLDQVSRPAGNRRSIADDLLLHFCM